MKVFTPPPLAIKQAALKALSESGLVKTPAGKNFQVYADTLMDGMPEFVRGQAPEYEDLSTLQPGMMGRLIMLRTDELVEDIQDQFENQSEDEKRIGCHVGIRACAVLK